MTQIKAYNPEVALEVGIQASLLLQHIKYWIEEYNLEKVYRTNKQISEDFKGTLSESQIQRAKKKLVEAGLITISHDKGHNRTTHFSLTEKAMKLYNIVKKTVETVKKVVKASVSRATKVFSENKAIKNSKSMEASFKEAGKNSKAIAMPEEALKLLGKIKPKKEVEVVETQTVQQEMLDDEDFINSTFDEDDYFKALDFGIQQCQQQTIEEPKMSFNDLMNQAFNRVPNIEVLEQNRKMLEEAKYFKEDF